MRATRSRPNDRRNEIVAAARACFLQFGYAKTSLDDIAKRANISRPLIYRSFKNKEDVFAAVYEATFETRFPEVERIVRSKASRREKLLRACEVLVLEPWEEIARGPMLAEYYDACERLLPEAEERSMRQKLKYATAILGKRDLAELFLLAAEGLTLDLPSPVVLRKRLRLLVERFLA